MPKFNANLTMLYTEVDFLDRYAAAAGAGFAGVEYLFPYAYPEAQVARAREDARVQQVLFNLPSGNWAGGERGIACLPDRTAEFREGVAKALSYAAALECKQLNCLAGIAPSDVPAAEIRHTFVENLRYAASELGKAGVALVVEPVNTFDIPGFYLSHSSQALDLLDEVGSDNIKLQYDIYHMQRMEGELAATIRKNLARIGHVQLADNPGRHEPGTGEINYPFLFKFLDDIGYDGWIGCEYNPLGTTAEGMHWAAAYLKPNAKLERSL